MKDKIGTNAGLVWNALLVGNLDIKALKKATKLCFINSMIKTYMPHLGGWLVKIKSTSWRPKANLS
mgnify:CR=1 FL=1